MKSQLRYLSLGVLRKGDRVLMRRVSRAKPGHFAPPRAGTVVAPRVPSTRCIRKFQTTLGTHSGALLYDEGLAIVVPKKVPKALRTLLNAQPRAIRRQLVVACVFNNTDEEHFTVACPRTFARMAAVIQTSEVADIRFTAEHAREGKPSIDECSTEYRVGNIVLEMPDSMEVERYQ